MFYAADNLEQILDWNLDTKYLLFSISMFIVYLFLFSHYALYLVKSKIFLFCDYFLYNLNDMINYVCHIGAVQILFAATNRKGLPNRQIGVI